MRAVADNFCEFVDDIRISEILFLCRRREDQMVAHEPGNRLGFRFLQAMFKTERLCVDRAEFGMITATPLGDVMKQAAQIGDLRLLE